MSDPKPTALDVLAQWIDGADDDAKPMLAELRALIDVDLISARQYTERNVLEFIAHELDCEAESFACIKAVTDLQTMARVTAERLVEVERDLREAKAITKELERVRREANDLASRLHTVTVVHSAPQDFPGTRN